MLVVLGVLYQWGRQGVVICDEPPVVPALAQEGAERLQCGGQGPVPDDRGVLREIMIP